MELVTRSSAGWACCRCFPWTSDLRLPWGSRTAWVRPMTWASMTWPPKTWMRPTTWSLRRLGCVRRLRSRGSAGVDEESLFWLLFGSFFGVGCPGSLARTAEGVLVVLGDGLVHEVHPQRRGTGGRVNPAAGPHVVDHGTLHGVLHFRRLGRRDARPRRRWTCRWCSQRTRSRWHQLLVPVLPAIGQGPRPWRRAWSRSSSWCRSCRRRTCGSTAWLQVSGLTLYLLPLHR